MKFLTTRGKVKDINLQNYLVNWDKKCRSIFQKTVQDYLRKFWEKDRCVAEFPVPGSRCSVDLINFDKMIAVEMQGAQHQNFIPGFFHKTPVDYLNQLKRDLMKEEVLRINRIKLIEIFPEDLPLTKKFFKDKYDIDL